MSDRGRSPVSAVERWWSRTAPRRREQLGIYHTPAELRRWIWRSLDPTKWSDPQTGLILDPAAGAGEFGRTAIEMAWRETRDPRRINELLGRLHSVEITLASYLAGWIEWGRLLLSLSGDDRVFRTPHWHWADATRVAGLCVDDEAIRSEASHESTWFESGSRQDIGWVVGNPPYSSRVESSWPGIERLLKGEIRGPGGDDSYFRFRGRPLGERKTWLHDLYVRFFRLAQWWTHANPNASVALITNRGWLTHKTFRGMRESLTSSFASIRIDLPSSQDDVWFDIATPVAIAFLSRRGKETTATDPAAQHGPRIEYRLLGQEAVARSFDPDENEAETGSQLSVARVTRSTPLEPWWEFMAPVSEGANTESHLDENQRRGAWLREQGWSLTEIFQRSGSVIVTARDALVIATSRRELRDRVERLLDPNVTDAEIRADYFAGPESPLRARRHTRLKLDEVRTRLRRRWDRHDWKRALTRCRYRGLDDRWILWDRDLVDWPRWESQATMAHGD
ncbi:MAG: type ISP restriction/modification enzyme [Pirellulaceae bacterium]